MAALLHADTATSGIATFDHRSFDAVSLLARKGARRIAVCIPARDEAPTIGAIVSAIQRDLVRDVPLVDEVVVVDDASADSTAETAAAAGARVVRGPGLGKGEAMATARYLEADIVVFLDGDVTGFASHFATGLLGPLLTGSGIELVKGRYRRPLGEDPEGGGRVTELTAKPALALLFPGLASVDQPLAGETAVTMTMLERLDLAPGYAVEVALLIDVWRAAGTEAIAQVDLGVRRHRNRPLAELVPEARSVLGAILERARL